MLFLTWYGVVPLVFMFGCIVQALRQPGTFWRRGGVYGLLAYLAAFALGILAIFESRGSTSGIALLFLPMIAVVPGVLGFILGALHHRYRKSRQDGSIPSWLVPAMALSAVGLVGALSVEVYGWYDTSRLNQSRDLEAKQQREAIQANRRTLTERLAANPGREAQLIEQMAGQTDDRAWLIPLASNPHASADTLDRLSQSADLGVVLSALRHANVPTAAIVRVYRTHSYPGYFFSTMAGNPNSPDWLLHELYQKRSQNLGITPALAGNPTTPPELIEVLLVGADQRTLTRLAQNPRLSCGQLDRVQANLLDERQSRPGSPLAKRLEACPRKAE